MCHPHVSVTPISHPHVDRTMLKGASVRDSKDTGSGKKERGFVILQQELNGEVKVTGTSQEHTNRPL